MERLKVTPAEVVNYYQNTDKEKQRNDVMDMILLYPNWYLNQFPISSLSTLTWYLDPNPNHISYLLTQKGTKRNLSDVALTYLNYAHVISSIWDGSEKIEELVNQISQKRTLPNLIFIKGPRYYQSPESSFIDGIHRSLAYSIYLAKTGNNLTISGFVGYKRYYPARLSSFS